MIRVGLGQIAAGTSAAANLKRIANTVDQAHGADVGLLILPEYSSYWDPDEFGRGFLKNAQSAADGEFVTRLTGLASSTDMWIVAGMLETAPQDDSRVFNTVVVFSPSGAVELTYRKVHLYDAFGGTESAFLLHGDVDQRTSFRAGGLTFGVSTCYDVRFPEIMRRSDVDPADVLVLPAVWTPGPLKSMHWEALIRARAIENTAYLAAVTPPAPESIGQSRVLNPDGTVLGEAGGKETLITVDLDAKVVRAERMRNTSLDSRRYRVIGD
ncbi:nitrilase-related carbon-nitrogen hydrolase [Paramicrobacterium chengjingii]|uniref:nitrilase-related carbon-nitrogen hydrolase n=1 Tax=Paramicrobacterium chengjingii TaxID=2769067 RepID=UPI00141E7101|nr:nitrilase-related carbon-nitrogen hydrolase [Microbacterium chengjingii]